MEASARNGGAMDPPHRCPCESHRYLCGRSRMRGKRYRSRGIRTAPLQVFCRPCLVALWWKPRARACGWGKRNANAGLSRRKRGDRKDAWQRMEHVVFDLNLVGTRNKRARPSLNMVAMHQDGRCDGVRACFSLVGSLYSMEENFLFEEDGCCVGGRKSTLLSLSSYTTNRHVSPLVPCLTPSKVPLRTCFGFLEGWIWPLYFETNFAETF